MKNILVVVDMQKDFVDGALGSADAVAIVPAVVKKIEGFEGDIYATLDTHYEELPLLIERAAGGDELNIELIGLCTDICVVSNALLLKAHFCESEITVDAACCAGVTPEAHKAALATMKSCHINVINEV